MSVALVDDHGIVHLGHVVSDIRHAWCDVMTVSVAQGSDITCFECLRQVWFLERRREKYRLDKLARLYASIVSRFIG